MAEKTKTVRGKIGDAVVVTSEENAARLGERFTPEKAAAKKSASSKSEK